MKLLISCAMNVPFGSKPQLHVQFQVAVIRNTVLSKISWNIGLKYIISQIQFSSVNCAEELMDPQNIKKSHSKSKFHSGQDVQFETITTSNDQFIDPGDILPYKLGSPHYRSEMRKTQRNKQSLQRKMDAERWRAKLPDITEEYTKHKLCRDERVVERNGVLYKDSNMWDSPSKRKRLKFYY